MIVRVDSTFARLDRMSAQIEAGEGALGFLMRDTLLVSRTQSALLALTDLLQNFKEHPERYVRLSIF